MYLARHNTTDEIVAIKQMSKSTLIKHKQVAHLINEKQVSQYIRHPFITRYLGSYKNSRFLYLILEFIQGGDFYTHLRNYKKFSVADAQFYSAIVVTVFVYLHNLKIIYRDLKPENLLLSTDGYIKFTDFGFSKLIVDRTYTLCGTPEYLAPEILLSKGYSFAVDWWTLGIFIYELMTGVTPFAASNVMSTYQKILQGKIIFQAGFDHNAKQLIKKLLAHDLSKRNSLISNGALGVINHPFYSTINFRDLIEKRITPPHIPKVSSPDDTSHFGHFDTVNEECSPIPYDSDPFKYW